jgi:GT2 family glycosyltransferase
LVAIEVPFRFIAIVVLYRVAADASRTLQSLALCDGLQACREVVVLDHSPQPDHGAFARLRERLRVPCSYAADPGNPPLGVAYNRAIRSHLGDADYVLTLDQDTDLAPSFLIAAAEGAQASGFASVMAPHIRAGTRIASPCWMFLGWGRGWQRPRPNWQSLRRCSLINSGAWIHRRVFEGFDLRYSEQLRLYGVDTDFFLRLSAHDARLWVLPIELMHELSFDLADRNGKIEKVGAILAANQVIYAGSPTRTRCAVSALSWLVRLRYALRYRDCRFL